MEGSRNPTPLQEAKERENSRLIIKQRIVVGKRDEESKRERNQDQGGKGREGVLSKPNRMEKEANTRRKNQVDIGIHRGEGSSPTVTRALPDFDRGDPPSRNLQGGREPGA